MGALNNPVGVSESAVGGPKRQAKERHKLPISYDHQRAFQRLGHSRKRGLPWILPEGARLTSGSSLPYVGCVSRWPVRRRADLVAGIETTDEFAASIPTFEKAAQRRTLADVKLYGSYWRCDWDHKSVYFLQSRDSQAGLIKIGFSREPSWRAYAVECQLFRESGLQVNLAVLATIPGNRDLERFLHAAFWEFHEFGEWFRPAPPLLALIAEIREAL